jgi:hypothetical protein
MQGEGALVISSIFLVLLTGSFSGYRDLVHAGISLSKIRIHLDLIPSRTKRYRSLLFSAVALTRTLTRAKVWWTKASRFSWNLLHCRFAHSWMHFDYLEP